MAKRLHYVDWLRVLAVLLLFPFHAGRVFNAGEDFYVKAVPTAQLLSWALAFISRWHMPLLFLLAGMSAFLAMRKRTPGQYAGERGLRLGVPLLFGLVLVTPLQGWFGARFNSGYTGSFLDYVISGKVVDLAGFGARDDYYGGFVIGHLWFVLFLLLISLAALPLIAWARREKGRAAMERWSRRFAKARWWLAIGVVLMIVEGLPWPGSHNLWYFLAWFLLGFVAAHDDSFADGAERYRWPTLAAGFVICVFYVSLYEWREALPDPSWTLAAVNITGMVGVLAACVGLLGLAKRHLDRPSPALSYLAEASYPVYILHQTVIVALGFYLVGVPGGTLVRYPLLTATSVAVTFALYEVIRRLQPLRFIFGMKKADSARPVPAEAAA